MPLTSSRNSSDRTEMSGLFSPASAKMSTTPSEATARDTICLMAESRSPVGVWSTADFFKRAALTIWKNLTSFPYSQGLLVWYGQGECTGQIQDRLQVSLFPTLLCQDVLLGCRD